MKAVAFSVRSFEKESLALANHKKHDITLISNDLSIETAIYAEGKEAVLVFTCDDLSEPVINKLADMGVKYICTRSTGTDHIDREAAAKRSVKVAYVPSYSPQSIAEQTVALALALSRKLIQSVNNSRQFNFTIDQLTGFTFYGKTVGLIGLGSIGQAMANIFKGLGCRVIGYDIVPRNLDNIQYVDLDTLFAEADVISLHAPLTSSTKYLINTERIAQMKKGVMLLNTSRGALIDTKAVLAALKTGKIGYLGLDVYENEKGLFFEDHSTDNHKDPLLTELMALPNVLVTPHQAFLTNEALQEIAVRTIKNLDQWQLNKCVGKACACAGACAVENSDQH